MKQASSLRVWGGDNARICKPVLALSCPDLTPETWRFPLSDGEGRLSAAKRGEVPYADPHLDLLAIQRRQSVSARHAPIMYNTRHYSRDQEDW
jgi:hypothetical protein